MADDLQAVLADAARAGLTSDAELEAVARQWEQQRQPSIMGGLKKIGAGDVLGGANDAITAWGAAGPKRVTTGLARLWNGPTADERMGGLADMGNGALATAAPMAAPAALGAVLAAPGTAAAMAGLGAAGSYVAPQLAKAAGAGPGGQDLAGLVGGLAGAGIGSPQARPIVKGITRKAADIIEEPLVSGVLGALPGLRSGNPGEAIIGMDVGLRSAKSAANLLRRMTGPSSADAATAHVPATSITETASPNISMANRPGIEAVALGQKSILAPDEVQQYLSITRRLFPGKSDAELLTLSPAQLTGMFHAGGSGR